MMFVVLALFLAIVAVLSWRAARSSRPPRGCCAPADPDDDLRMRDATS